ncbi:MAG: response regulator [Acidobacteriaceae bacterium]|nr:response regulator [Acidobacteriaceae bacterium]
MSESPITASSILIVDDHEPSIRFLNFILNSAGYRDVRCVTDPSRALAACRERKPDLVLLDINAPHLGGLSLIKRMLDEARDDLYFPVLVVTADLASDAKLKALLIGAKDFVPKPLDAAELLLRVKTLLETRALYKRIETDNRTFEDEVDHRIRELAQAEVEILSRLATAAEYRDDESGQHPKRVGLLSAMLSQALGQPSEQVELILVAAPLHDLGKVAVPDRILSKTGKLSELEWNVMKSHTTVGAQVLSGSRLRVLQIASEVALSHHERWDGAGYPQGLRGELIPLPARITAIADVFDALTHPRPYKEAWSLEKAINTFEKESGGQFDPALIPPFLSLLRTEGIERLATKLNEQARIPTQVESSVLAVVS